MLVYVHHKVSAKTDGSGFKVNVGIQWNPSIAATLGEQNFGCYNVYRGWPLLKGCFVQTWPLYRGGLYSGVAVKRGCTVNTFYKGKR